MRLYQMIYRKLKRFLSPSYICLYIEKSGAKNLFEVAAGESSKLSKTGVLYMYVLNFPTLLYKMIGKVIYNYMIKVFMWKINIKT